ncbi:DUF5333 domain-containing protein [Celeribacter litoreus]|uniref:DUF5333 domain-containing protein n=1 Tax=Celeribacter litoreus TaxID=2876714 RepID=UPI001CCF3CF6|nr:DUF5333 domain-containing protein [Celeribacter litoreus]MCA0045267.1 DUF5333 domain-containing protein [Celeribacter litoreus]
MKALKYFGFSLAMMSGAAAAAELPPLREQKAIDTNMLWAGLAIETSDQCPTLDLRTFKGLTFLWGVKTDASDLGYTDDQIRAYVESDAEKDRIRALGTKYIADAGFDPSTPEGLCAFGEAEIARGSIIGSFLKDVK